jgi:hypothetical protein
MTSAQRMIPPPIKGSRIPLPAFFPSRIFFSQIVLRSAYSKSRIRCQSELSKLLFRPTFSAPLRCYGWPYFKPAFSSLSRLWARSTKTMSPVNTRDEIPGGLETPTLANPKPTVKVPSPMPEGSYEMKIHEPKVLKGCGSLEASVR